MANADREKILSILKKTAAHAFLATCDGGAPVIRSVSPIVEDDLSMWIATFANADKVKQVRKNPNVCLHFVSHPNGDQGATVRGRAVLVEDIETKRRVWGKASYDLAGYFPGGPESEAYGLLKIVPETITWRDNWEEGQHVHRVS
jgi:general stress protein 26